jgi:8-oxo-dGTP pyrophosphatase MutT (NUDIX family)
MFVATVRLPDGATILRDAEDHGQAMAVLPYDPEACARREAMEGTGLRIGELEPVLAAWTMPALSTERAHLFLVPYRAADRGGLASEQECIAVAEVPPAGSPAWRTTAR